MAAGSGLTAGVDTGITNTLIALASSKYQDTSTTGGNWWGCCTNQFTAAAKTLATAVEWLVASDTAYARQPMGAAGIGWTVAAYVASTGVVWKNTNTLTQPAVLGANQSLFSCSWHDQLAVGGNCQYFIDLAAAQAVNIGTAVILTALTGAVFTTY
jgi:hypothetical protein